MSRTPTMTPSADELRAEIAQTRAELGQTVQALAAKADVSARLRHALADRRQQAVSALGQTLDRVGARMPGGSFSAAAHRAGQTAARGVAAGRRDARRELAADASTAPFQGALRQYGWLVPAGAALAAVVGVALARRGR